MSKSLNDLGLELGDILVCDSSDSCFFTYGVEYLVQQAKDGRLGILNDCGFVSTTSLSLFTRKRVVSGFPIHPTRKVARTTCVTSCMPPPLFGDEKEFDSPHMEPVGAPHENVPSLEISTR